MESNMRNMIRMAAQGRLGNMSKRLTGETDQEFAVRLTRLAQLDIKAPVDVYVASGIQEGIAGFYVSAGRPINLDGFKKIEVSHVH